MKKYLSLLLKLLVILSAIGGVVLSLLQAQADGYSHWGKRLLYFTSQSNLWLGVSFIFLFFFSLFNRKIPKLLFFLQFIFTVCITLTLLVFCFVLVPFAPPEYHLDSFASMLTHFFSPCFAIVDFFLSEYSRPLLKKHALLCAIPPFFYTLSVFILSANHMDFGRGVCYPYVFMDYQSKAKIFGFCKNIPFIGAGYWIGILSLLVISVGILFVYLHRKKIKK